MATAVQVVVAAILPVVVVGGLLVAVMTWRGQAEKQAHADEENASLTATHQVQRLGETLSEARAAWAQEHAEDLERLSSATAALAATRIHLAAAESARDQNAADRDAARAQAQTTQTALDAAKTALNAATAANQQKDAQIAQLQADLAARSATAATVAAPAPSP
jgi:hypothetical protein